MFFQQGEVGVEWMPRCAAMPNSERFYAIPAIAQTIKNDKINLCETFSALKFGIWNFWIIEEKHHRAKTTGISSQREV